MNHLCVAHTHRDPPVASRQWSFRRERPALSRPSSKERGENYIRRRAIPTSPNRPAATKAHVPGSGTFAAKKVSGPPATPDALADKPMRFSPKFPEKAAVCAAAACTQSKLKSNPAVPIPANVSANDTGFDRSPEVNSGVPVGE